MRQKIKSTHLTRNLSIDEPNQSIIAHQKKNYKCPEVFTPELISRNAYFINITDFAKKISLTQRRIIYIAKKVNKKPWRAVPLK